MTRRSKLITPALRRDLLEKAATCDTDVVHIELEDGVPAGQKDSARQSALRALREIDWNGHEVWVRVNTPGTEEAGRDVEMIVEGAPDALLIPKVRGPEDITEVAALISAAERTHGLREGQIAIAAVIEQIVGLSNVEEIAKAHPRMTALVLGTEDMSVEYGYRLDRTGHSFETLYLKSRCILAARLAGIDCIDAPHFHYRDLDGTRRAAAWAAQLGFSGKTCLTPPQVAPVNEAFEPSAEDIGWATRVLEALDEAASNDLSVAIADGMMVDAPHALQAHRILHRADAERPSLSHHRRQPQSRKALVMPEHNAMPVATANFGYFYHRGLGDSLRDIADAGYTRLELTTGAPHIDLSEFGADARRRVKQEIDSLGLKVVSTNPIELNPISGNDDLKQATYRQYRAAIEFTAELGGGSVVMIAGRRSPLIPMPEEQAKDLLRAQLERLLPDAQKLGVVIALEPVPFGFLQTAREVAPFVRDFGADALGIALDCANSFFAGADPAEEVRASGELTAIVHISDSWRDRFAHTHVGGAEIDFEAFAKALRESEYKGTTVYELVDGDDPAPRLRSGRAVLSGWGWR